MNTGRRALGGAGIITSALAFGGEHSGASESDLNETFNGTSWTEVADMNSARQNGTGLGASNTAALSFGGNVPGITANTELWNGTAWAEQNNLIVVSRSSSTMTGTSSSGLTAGGDRDGTNLTAATQEWNEPAKITQEFDLS